MFQSLDYKNGVDAATNEFVNARYEGSGINDQTFGRMYYYKQLSKAADEMYNQLRNRIDHKDAVNKTVVASDKYFSVVASTRAGSAKIDRALMLTALTDMVKSVALTAGADLSDIQAANQAAAIIERCTVYGKGSTVISVVENSNA